MADIEPLNRRFAQSFPQFGRRFTRDNLVARALNHQNVARAIFVGVIKRVGQRQIGIGDLGGINGFVNA